MSEILVYAAVVAFVLSQIANIFEPFLVLRKLEKIEERIHHLEYAVSCITPDDDPDPGDDQETVEPSNVVAIGKRAA